MVYDRRNNGIIATGEARAWTEQSDGAGLCLWRTMTTLRPDPKNANKGTQRGRGLLEKSLRSYGAGRSILADRNGVIVAGNQTLDVATELGIPHRIIQSDGTELIVVQRTDLDMTDTAARELAVADNRTSELGLDWDTEVLAELIADDVDLTQFWHEDELSELLAHSTGTLTDVQAPEGFATYDETIETAYCCPSCGYEWSGKPK